MRTLAVLSQKGGTGKTTVAVQLAVAAWTRGRCVLMADIDPQRSAAEWRRTRGRPGPGLIECKPGALFVAQKAAERAGVDLMVLDTRPSGDADTAEAIRCADLCLIVARPSFFDLKTVAPMLQMTRAMGKAALVLLNQAPPRRGLREPPAVIEALEMLKTSGAPLAPVGLRARTLYQTAAAKGLAAEELAPGGVAAQEISLLWEHLDSVLWTTGQGARRPQPAGQVRGRPAPPAIAAAE